MKDYYNIIVDLSCKRCNKDDYGSKKRVREHNKAMDKLFKLGKELNNPEGKELLLKLLYHENEHVILVATMFCAKLGFHPDETLERLIYVKNNSKDFIME
jgi:hypothetical protein